MSDFRHQWRAAVTSETSAASSTQRLVGLILADYANRENAFAWPSVETLRRRCGLGERTVRLALHGLVELRFLAVAREGKGHTTTFQLVLNPGTTYRTTPAADADPPRHLTTPTPARRSETPASPAPEPLRGGKNLDAPAALALEGSPPLGAELRPAGTCTGCGQHADQRYAVYEHPIAYSLEEGSNEPYLTLERPSDQEKPVAIDCTTCLMAEIPNLVEAAENREAAA